MKTWHYYINSYHDSGHIELVEMPWFLHCADWFAGRCMPEWTFRVPLPDFPPAKRDPEEETLYTPREYWGTLGELLCWKVCNPLHQWVQRHRLRRETYLDLGYGKLKKLFYRESPEFFDYDEKISTEIREEWGDPR